MRYFLGFICALALGMMPLVGCSDPEGTGGSGGSAGDGGSGGFGGTGGAGGSGGMDGVGGNGGSAGSGGVGGDGGSAGSGGMGGDAGSGGDGGSGGMPECLMCNDGEECTEDVCTDGMCSHTAVEDDTECDFDGLPGLCMSGICKDAMLCVGIECDDENLCTDDACNPANGICDYIPVDCDDGNACTDDVCNPTDGCKYTPVEGGTGCGSDAGTCQQGTCTVACDEQGIHDAIAAGGGPYTFDCGGPTTVVTDAEIDIDNDVILDGEGNLTVDGNESHRVFYVAESVTAELRGFTVTRGAATGSQGGGIMNEGALFVNDCTISGNTARDGGGIANDWPGQMTITNSTVSGNTAAGEGGGIFNDASLTLTNSTVSGNDGFGITNFWGGYATLTNTTISGNSEGSLGVVCVLHFLFDCGWFRLINSTVSGNTACLDNGFECYVSVTDGVSFVIWTNTVIDGVCGGDWRATSNGYNIESPGDTCGFDQGTDETGVTEQELNLGPLQLNGGSTETHEPGGGDFGDGSVAIDVIPEGECSVDTDQRGEPRPAGPDPKRCDVGSFEVQPAP